MGPLSQSLLMAIAALAIGTLLVQSAPEKGNSMFKIYAQFWGDNVPSHPKYSFMVRPTTTIEKLKQAIQKASGYRADKLELAFDGQDIWDYESYHAVEDLRMEDGSVVFVYLKN